MTAAGRLQSAIEKLEQLRADAFPGPWEAYNSRPENGSHSFVMADHSAILSVSANDGSEEEFRAPTADLVAVLHRTIDAQIAILREGITWLEWVPELTAAAASETALADAILGTPSKRTPTEWESILGIKVHDPDGWDRSNFAESWAEKFTEVEFARRAWASTCSGDFDRIHTILRANS